MALSSNRWHTIAESQFPWERDALDYLRERLPDQEPFRAWSNFEFIADDGSVYEVDLVVLTAAGFPPDRDQEPSGHGGRRRSHLDLERRRSGVCH